MNKEIADQDIFEEYYFQKYIKNKTGRDRKYITFCNMLPKEFKNGIGKKALDIGCATGYGLIILQKMGYEVYGIDVSNYMIEETKKKIKNIFLRAHDIEKSPPFDGKFDLITCFDVIEHMHKPERGIKNIYDSLAKGGILIASTPNPISPFAFIWDNILGFKDETHINIKSAKGWENIFKQFDWNRLEIVYRQWLPFMWKITDGKSHYNIGSLGGQIIIMAIKD